MKKIIIVLLLLFMIVGCSTNKTLKNKYEGSVSIVLNGSEATIDGEKIEVYDYTWHVDPSVVHNDVKDSPAEYYTGNKPENEEIYIDHELYYYPSLDQNKFKMINYDGEREYAYYYEDGENNDYIFSTLPCFRTFPSDMMFQEEEANKYVVLHINKPGIYILEGSFKGQINVDLGEDAFDDPSAIVTFVLNNVNVECGVAPAFIVENAYECDNTWEDDNRNNAVDNINDAGVKVIVADNTTNNFTGANIYRMLKTKYKDEESKGKNTVQKKARKYDAPFYSCVSMNIDGEKKDNGILNITSTFEGLDTELHLAINGAVININSKDDGINVNEDNISTLFINGGKTTLNAGLGEEGDGIDSNGYVVINGGKLYINNIEAPDNYVDSEDGIFYNQGEVYLDNKLEELSAGSTLKEIGNQMGFGGPMGDAFKDIKFDISEFKKKIAELDDEASLQDILELLGINNGFDRKEFDREEKDSNDNKDKFDKKIEEIKEKVKEVIPFEEKGFDLEEFIKKVEELDEDATIQDILGLLGTNINFPPMNMDGRFDKPEGEPGDVPPDAK